MTALPATPGGAAGLAVLALVLNAFVWGTSWWPMRHLHALGVHPLWSTTLAYALATLTILAARPRALGRFLGRPALWLLVVASGTTNAAFNWAVVIGDVVRVVLLFYLMPIWAVLLARVFLGERIDAAALVRVGVGAAGAAIVLWPASPAAGVGASTWTPTLADALGVLGGLAFAFNNVMLRREANQPEEARALAMFAGGALVAGTLATVLSATGALAAPRLGAPAAALLAVLTVAFLLANLGLQYGAARLPANRTAVVMLTEVLFAALSAVALGAGELSPRVAFGGALIVAAALLAALPSPRSAHP